MLLSVVLSFIIVILLKSWQEILGKFVFIKYVFIQSNSDFITSLKNAHFPSKKMDILCKIEG